MLDKGTKLAGSKWPAQLGSLGPGGLSILHAVRYNEILNPGSQPNGVRTPSTDTSKAHPYHPYRDCSSPETSRLLQYSPAVGLYTLLSSAALSWNQVLNYIEDDIDENQDAEDDDSTNEALAQIRFDLRTVHRFKTFIHRDLDLLHDCPTWAARGTTSPELHPIDTTASTSAVDTEVETMRFTLLKDYKDLVGKCQLLVERCESSSNVLQSAVQLEEAHRSMGQTAEINKLTRIVFVLAPLSFVSSIFGMNVIEITPDSAVASLWHFALAALVVLAISIHFGFSVLGQPRFLGILRRKAETRLHKEEDIELQGRQ
ncbi:hypothetical protein PG996_009346 [Apiospora saccharicola]|uniref:Uncharacterized protein n=1 Tax=Apiospora saccharicola TaxID=335842 RepID=A0ABR1UKG8_9PEZI